MNSSFIKNLFVWFIIFASLMGAYQILSEGKRNKTEIQYSEFLNRLDSGEVLDVEVKGNQISGQYIPINGSGGTVFFETYGPAGDDLLKQMKEKRVNFKFISTQESGFFAFLINWAPMIILIALMIFFIRQIQAGGRGAMSFGKSRAKKLSKEDNKKTFADVAGIDEAKDEVQEIVDFLKNPKKFTKLGGRIPKGILLVGSPGTGKTLLAKAIAGEAGVPFFIISGSDFVEMFVGVGASRVRDLFAQAKKNSPCIIFVDELDAVGRHRGAGLGGGHDEREQTLNQLLVEMDGFEATEGIIVMAATNRPDVLDPAILRPGRFDRQVVVPKPDVKGREEILKVHSKNVPLDSDVELNTVARSTPGFSGADLENLINEAAIRAARESHTKISMNDIEFAKDKVIMGSERKSLVINEHERKVTAYHEAGHALVAKLTPGTDPVHKVTIIPRGMALGLTMQIPIEDKYMMSRDYLLKTINILLAGRAAEEIIFNERTTGAGNDLERASEIARKMVTEWGMSEKVGPIRLTKKEGEVFLGKEMSTGSQLSPTTSEIIDSEIKSIIVNANNEAVNLLKENEKFLHDLANLLLEQEVVDSKELNKLLGIEEEVKSPSNNNEQEKASNWSPITPETTTAFSEIED
ncbi:MAG: ATP-dependent metallopeptidase FtsH/Yme1/Tma family protein [Deltaproteobacteria bacterium TMED126]|jgi:cell division protease FtsH|nr:ATP-dependent metallopeptidase FtsH/Yme1/Tma family protein [Candidatus Dadabacteria bacterium]NSW96998.1 ATP-dependent metallopeptidase FtsH/Yme1/Tma family protein [Deltaproteobacteria bacterium TMED126]|tara:strand:- start:1512 stop:3419 length:1908 start_codon:yes stop_codon:yes gene_type:complete